eukprot:CAMPEP_0194046238 /NCGR_PEP_ID=MMETSP0009_2-20130614/20065_1 /TAXON_ID=210454 /ORGANISM="Grammatophora oceanica, Strain CCMP 410" /LENGTH=214 /DNA_ID=CAMNT_0038691445 /DNA_START=112 /DNA_END=756 /DNA_ORIENTATION=+
MCAVATMKRSYDAITTPTHFIPADEVDAMIVTYEYEQKQQQRKRRRVVRFSEQDNQEHNVSVDDNTWLSREEYGLIREGAARDMRAVAHSVLRPKSLLDDTVYSVSEADDENDELPHKVPPRTEDILGNLTKWAQYIDPGRGLESQINRNLGKARRKHRSRAIRAVMIGQKIAREEKHNVEKAKLLGLVSEKYSALAKKHALLMGKADEKAALL